MIFVAGGDCEQSFRVRCEGEFLSLKTLRIAKKNIINHNLALKVRFVTMSLMMTWTSCSRRCSEQGACLPKSKPSLLNGFEENIDRLAPCAGRNWLQRHLSFDHMFCDACLVDFDQHVPIVFFFGTPLTHDVSSYLMAAPMPGPVAARAHHSDRLCDLCRRAVFGGSV